MKRSHRAVVFTVLSSLLFCTQIHCFGTDLTKHPRATDAGPHDRAVMPDAGDAGDSQVADIGLDAKPEMDLMKPDLGPDAADLSKPDLGPDAADLSKPDLGPDAADLGQPDLGPDAADLGQLDLGPDAADLGQPDLSPDAADLWQPDLADLTQSDQGGDLPQDQQLKPGDGAPDQQSDLSKPDGGPPVDQAPGTDTQSDLPSLPDLGCGGYSAVGCCASEVLKRCDNNKLVQQDCAATGNPKCGWDTQQKRYSCGTSGKTDPSGKHPRTCAVADGGSDFAVDLAAQDGVPPDVKPPSDAAPPDAAPAPDLPPAPDKGQE